MAASTNSGFYSIFKPLYWLFGRVMEGLLMVFDYKYFIALIVFTVLTRLILFPINLRQQKNMAKTTRLQPKIQKIQKKYANSRDPKDRQRQQEEMQELYNREGHNPMNMGCGPMIFQMVFLMGIIGIIYYPIQYVLGIGNFAEIAQKVAEATNYSGRYIQLEILQHLDQYKAVLVENGMTEAQLSSIGQLKDSLMLFGKLDMTQIPKFKEFFSNSISIIPALCLVSSLATSLMSTWIQKKQNPAVAAQGNQMMIMMLMMPLFSFYISFQVSAAVGFYWIISNLVALVQQLVTAKFFPPKRNVARQMIEATIERRSREESIKNAKD